MSIKLSIKDLKDLLKIQNKQIKNKKRRRNKKVIKNSYDNYNKSSSDHMLSTGFTNTSNESTELIRLQRQALEDKLKEDKENKIKKEAAEKEAKEQNVQDNVGGMVPFNRLAGNGGSNDLRNEINGIHKTVNYMMMMPGYLEFPAHGRPAQEVRNVGYDGPQIEEVEPVEETKQIDAVGKEPAIAEPPQINEAVKNPAIEETEPNYNPDDLNIRDSKTKKPQLIGWINHKRGNMDPKLIKMSKPQLLNIAESIVLEEEEQQQQKEAQLRKEARADVKAAKAKARLEAEAKEKAEAELEEAARAAELKRRADAKAEKARLRAEADAKAKLEAEAAEKSAAEKAAKAVADKKKKKTKK